MSKAKQRRGYPAGDIRLWVRVDIQLAAALDRVRVALPSRVFQGKDGATRATAARVVLREALLGQPVERC